MHRAEVRSLNVSKWRSTSTLTVLLLKHTKAEFVVHIPFVNTKSKNALDIPFDLLVLALQNDDDAMIWLKKHHNQNIPLDTEVLPHLGMGADAITRRKKIFFLRRMRERILLVVEGKRDVDDRDHQRNRRVDGPGPLLAILFRQLFRNHLKTKKLALKRTVDMGKPFNIENFLHFRKITSGLRYHFATGNWSLTKGVNTGVVQLLNTMSIPSQRSHLSRISTPMNREGKAVLPRMLHVSSFGILCPSETPEGQSCGLLNQKAMLCHVTTGISVQGIELLKQFLLLQSMNKLTAGALRFRHKNTIVLICGDVVGYVETNRAVSFVKTLRRFRSNCTIPLFVGIVHLARMNEIHIQVQPGRLVRPLFVVRKVKELLSRKNAADLLSWDAFVQAGAIVYLDKAEESDIVIDGSTYDEVVKSGIMSSTVAQIPFACRNQAPRNIYQSSMGKQAISFPSLVHGHAFNSVHSYVLNYPQRGLLETKFTKIMCNPPMPTTQCAIVAIMIRGGYNQEDAIIVNKASIERGFGGITYYRNFTDEITSRGTEQEQFERPTDTTRSNFSSIATVASDGVPDVGAQLKATDCIIGKTAKIRHLEVKRDRSTYLKHGQSGTVDKVCLSTTHDGKRQVAVRIRRQMPISEGDKLASVHGQKVRIKCSTYLKKNA